MLLTDTRMGGEEDVKKEEDQRVFSFGSFFFHSVVQISVVDQH